ncbi:MAG: hypothetical protein IKY41_00480, partial [Clostridia bacterium]|nr:hypothetical protein [Clostridia bacterium]
MKIRKILSVTLCLLLIIGALPVSAAKEMFTDKNNQQSQSSTTTINTVMVFDIDEPVDGANFDRFATIQSGKGYKIYSQPEWYDETDDKILEEGDTFTEGHIYTVSVWLEADDGYEFASTTTTTDVTATLNGKGAKAGKAYEYQRWAMVVVSYTFPAVSTGKPVGAISIEIPKPVPGEKASFNAKLTAEGAKMMTKIPDLASIYQDTINGVEWKDDTANRRLNEGDTFIVGHSYTLSVFLEPETGYKFDVTDDNYSITINGVEPDPISSFGMERRGYWIEYDCLAEVGNADFYAVDPAVGHHTYYDVVCNNNPGVELKAKKVVYYDASERMSYYSTTAFEEGHYYELEFRIKSKSGYIFAPDENGKPDISKLTVNGNPITDASYYAPDKSEITILCVYDKLKQNVNSVPVVPDKNEQINGVLKYVKVYDVAEPKAGELPDVKGVVLSRRYDIPHLVANKIDFIWTNVTDNKEMDLENDKFENGKEYQVQVGVSGYDFSSLSKSDKSALKGYINDKEV